jgi:predicted aconitase
MQDGVGRMVKEQPFAVAALGFAAGAAVAAFLPPTRAERDTLRPLGQAAADAAAAGLDQIKGAASATGEQLKDAAQRRGLSAEGIKDMAREATQTFTDKLAANVAREPEAAPLSGGRM